MRLDNTYNLNISQYDWELLYNLQYVIIDITQKIQCNVLLYCLLLSGNNLYIHYNPVLIVFDNHENSDETL